MQADHRRSTRTITAYDLLPPDPAGRQRPAAIRPAPPSAVEDAVFEVIGPVTRAGFKSNDNPPSARPPEPNPAARLAAVMAIRLVNAAERALSRLSPQAFATLLTAFFLTVFWLFGGFAALGGQAPVLQAAVPGLFVEDVIARTEDANGMKVILVEGRLTNTSTAPIDVPDLVVARQADGTALGLIRPPAATIGPASSIRFTARLKHAGGKSGAITVFPKPV